MVKTLIKQKELNVLIAEDHTLIRKVTDQILKSRYSYVTCMGTDNTEDLIKYSKENKYDLIILDIFLTDGNTISLLSTLRVIQPQAAILFYSMGAEELYAKRLILNGANGFINKCTSESEFHKAIDMVLSGECYLSWQLQYNLVQETIQKKPADLFSQLSDREFEVMLLLLQGHSLGEISSQLHIHVSTASTHKTRLFEKLNVTSLMQLNSLASVNKLVS